MRMYACMCVGNNIGDEGAKILGESLKHNTVLTLLGLKRMKPLTSSDFRMRIDMCGLQGIGLVSKEQWLSENLWNTMLHSLF